MTIQRLNLSRKGGASSGDDGVAVRFRHVVVNTIYGLARHTDTFMTWRGRTYGSRLAGHLPESVVMGVEKPRFIERRKAEEAKCPSTK